MPKLLPTLPEAVLPSEQPAIMEQCKIAEFGRFEAMVGRELTAAEREELAAISARYTISRAIELSSPKIRSTQRRLKSVRAAADALRLALTSSDEHHTAYLAGRLINEQLKGRVRSRAISGRVEARTIRSLMRDLAEAAEKASYSVQFSAVQASAWTRFVADLDSWAAVLGFPTKVSKKSVGKSGPLKPSPYLQLAQAVIETWPENLRQHHHAMVTVDALAQAIHRARRDATCSADAE